MFNIVCDSVLANNWLTTATPTEIGDVLECGLPAYLKMTLKAKQEAPPQHREKTEIIVPVEKGIIGEEYIEKILRDKYGTIKNVAKTSMSGDLTLLIQHKKFIVEVKNYSNSVPLSGVDKFRRDLCTTQANAGIFISLRTPIANITNDFVIRYETTETKSIPCAYIVSSDPSAIVIAINMVYSLLQGIEFINNELYNRDKILAGLYEIDNNVMQWARNRHELQTNLLNIYQMLMKNNTSLANSESNIKKIIDEIKTDMTHQVCDNNVAIVEISKIQLYSRQTKIVQDLINKLVVKLNQHNDIEIGWKIAAKKCLHLKTGICINFSAYKAEICFPRNLLNSDQLIFLINNFPADFAFDDLCKINIIEPTYEWLTESGVI